MRVIRDLERALRPAAVALGNFDGIHSGHQRVIQPILQPARGVSTVLTFDPHPREVFEGRSLSFLTPLPEKLALLETIGLQQVVLLPFSRDFARRDPRSFLVDILETGLDTCQISVGWDFCFGRQRSGNASTLQAWGQGRRIPVSIVPEWKVEGERASSSAIRKALANGNVAGAKAMLGRCYPVRGLVESGDRRGRQIGFPTANVRVSQRKVLPRDGVYAGRAQWTSRNGLEKTAIAAINIGRRPTFDGNTRTVEVHLLDWSGDLYGRVLQVEFEQFLRPERKFDGIEALQVQLQQDCLHVRHVLSEEAASDVSPLRSPAFS